MLDVYETQNKPEHYDTKPVEAGVPAKVSFNPTALESSEHGVGYIKYYQPQKKANHEQNRKQEALRGKRCAIYPRTGRRQ